MITWGITALNHDASIAVIKDDKLAFWAQSRNYTYSGDELLCKPLIYDVLAHGKPDQIAWYERPLIKKFRQLYAGQYADAFDSQVLPSIYLEKLPIPSIPIKYFSHHKTHAAAGFYTSTFDSAAIVVLDAGIATEENLQLIQTKGYDYVCVSRSKIKDYTLKTDNPNT